MATTTQTPFPSTPASPASSSGASSPIGGGSSGTGSSVGSGSSLGSGSLSSAAGSSGSMDSAYGSSGRSGMDSGSESTGRNERMERVVQSAHQAVDTLAAKAAPLVDRFSSGLDGASSSVHDRADQLTALQEEWVESARTTVREHPLASLAAAVAVGMLLSRLSR